MNDFPALPRHEVALVIGGSAYLGWTALSVERAIDQMAGSFELELTVRAEAAMPVFPIKADDACQIVLGGKPLITGWIDRVSRGLAADTKTLQISGRDKAADLVDCSAIHAKGSWSKVKLATIAQELAAPFGVSVAVTGDQGAVLQKFALQQGETVFAALERLARYRGLIVFSDGIGGVTIGNPDSGKRAGRIVEGINLLSIDAGLDHSQRFSSYLIKGQSSGSDERNGKVVAQVKGEASDAAVRRHRPLLIIGEEQSTAANLKTRAEWEMKTRAARAETVTLAVPGWFAGDGAASGPVWEPGARAELAVPTTEISGDRLIERVRLIRDDQGTRSELTMVPPDAWAQIAEAEPNE